MSNAMGVIYANSGTDNLQGLALKRPIAAVPFGGRYRLVDFALSSMVNSGIRTIGVVIPHQYRPLLDHLGAGKAWFLDRKAGGLFILPGAIHGFSGSNYHTTFCVKDLQKNIEYLQSGFEENVIISSGDQIFNLNYKNMLEVHNDTRSDVTLIYKEMKKPHDPAESKVLVMDEEQNVTRIISNQADGFQNRNDLQPHFVKMLIIRRELLQEIVGKYSSVGCLDLVDILAANLEVLQVRGLSTCALIGTVHSLKDYFDRSMELLDLETRGRLWLGVDQIHTKLKDYPPTRYTSQAKVSNSLIASGCTISGEVANSIIFRGVIIEEGCKIENSIILPKCHIHAQAQTDYAVLDKSVQVIENNVLKGSAKNPIVVLKRTVI